MSKNATHESRLFRSLCRSTQFVAIALGTLLAIGAILLGRGVSSFEASAREQQAHSLAWHVKAADRAMDLWFDTQERFVARLAAQPRLVSLAKRILHEPSTPDGLACSEVQAEIRGLLGPQIEVIDGRGIFILGPDNVSFASMRDTNLGQENFLVREHPLAIQQAWQGNLVAVPPVRSDVPLHDPANPGSPTPEVDGVRDRSLFLAAPMWDEDGKVFAVLAVRYDASETIDRILRGKDRDHVLDAFAFDRNGCFVTRPGNALAAHREAPDSLAGSETVCLSYLDARVALAGSDDDELTSLAKRALTQSRGAAAEGYESYAGHRVLGAWAWNDRFDLGLAAEVREDWALKTFAHINDQVRVLAWLVLALSIGLVLSSLFYRRVTVIQARKLQLDPLTGIACRGHFDARLATELKVAARSHAPISLVLLDIDEFKAFNDTHGHPAGDACLRTVAACLSATCRRPSDLAARYGGEEFALVLPATDAEGAAGVAWALRQAVQACNVPHGGSIASDRVTVSIGVATCVSPRDSDAAEKLIDQADKRLYRAKNLGRDTVVASAGTQREDPPSEDVRLVFRPPSEPDMKAAA